MIKFSVLCAMQLECLEYAHTFQEGPIKPIGDDSSDTMNQIPSIQGIMQLKDSDRNLQAAIMAFQVTNTGILLGLV